jgi:hypothetical protein
VLNAKKLRPMVRVFCGGGRDVYYFIIADPVCECVRDSCVLPQCASARERKMICR